MMVHREFSAKNADFAATGDFDLWTRCTRWKNQVADKKTRYTTKIVREHSEILKIVGIKTLPRLF